MIRLRWLVPAIIILWTGGVHAQSCTPNNNSDFVLSGTNNATITSSTPLAAGSYTVGTVVTMSGVSNSGTCIPVTVTATSGGGGGVQPYGNVPCPGGCAWANVFNDDFRVDTFFNADNTTAVTNAQWYMPVDGSSNPSSGGGTFACNSGALDTSHLPGHLSVHAIGTLSWETAGNLSCGFFPKVSNSQSPPGCPNGWYAEGCAPVGKPTLWEYMAQEAPNQIDEMAIWGGPPSPRTCFIITYFGESRGNGTHNYTSMYDWLTGDCSYPAQDRSNQPWQQSDGAPHVSALLFTPNVGWKWYWDGVLMQSADPQHCATDPNCASKYQAGWEFNIAPWIGPGGSFDLYFARAYVGN